MRNKIIYVDMDGVLTDFRKSFSNSIKKNPEITYPQSKYGFFRKLPSIDGAIESFNWLFEQDFFDVYILTAPSVHNPSCYTEKREWVEDHLGMKAVRKLIISPAKNLNMGDYLIDDHRNGNGQDLFKGEFIHFGGEKYKNWTDVVNYFKLMYNLY